MKRKIFLLFCVLLVMPISFFSVGAEDYYTLVDEVDCYDFKDYIHTQVSASIVSESVYGHSYQYELNGHITSPKSFINVFGLSIDSSATYHLKCECQNIQFKIFYHDSSGNTTNQSFMNGFEGDFSGIMNINFYPLNDGVHDFSSFKQFTISQVPPGPPPLSPSDFTSFLTFVGSSFSSMFDLICDYWWALAFLCIPLVYLILSYFADVFRSDVVYSRFSSAYRAKNFRKSIVGFFIPKNKKNKCHFQPYYFVIDGQTYFGSAKFMKIRDSVLNDSHRKSSPARRRPKKNHHNISDDFADERPKVDVSIAVDDD